MAPLARGAPRPARSSRADGHQWRGGGGGEDQGCLDWGFLRFWVLGSGFWVLGSGFWALRRCRYGGQRAAGWYEWYDAVVARLWVRAVGAKDVGRKRRVGRAAARDGQTAAWTSTRRDAP